MDHSVIQPLFCRARLGHVNIHGIIAGRVFTSTSVQRIIGTYFEGDEPPPVITFSLRQIVMESSKIFAEIRFIHFSTYIRNAV